LFRTTYISFRGHRANAEVMTYSQPRRAACFPTPRYLDTIVYEKYSRFIHLFIFYMIFINGYRRTFCALLYGISDTSLILLLLAQFFLQT